MKLDLFSRTDAEGSPSDHASRVAMEKAGRNPDLPPNHPINALSNAHKFMILVTLSFSGCLMNFMCASSWTG